MLNLISNSPLLASSLLWFLRIKETEPQTVLVKGLNSQWVNNMKCCVRKTTEEENEIKGIEFARPLLIFWLWMLAWKDETDKEHLERITRDWLLGSKSGANWDANNLFYSSNELTHRSTRRKREDSIQLEATGQVEFCSWNWYWCDLDGWGGISHSILSLNWQHKPWNWAR